MSRSRVVWLLQIALTGAVVALLGRTLVQQWSEFRAVEFPTRLHGGWILLSAGIVLATYALLIVAWRVVITGWNERLSYRHAVGVWTLSNLGRYLPGKVWSVAGLAVLAQRAGVAGWAAVGAAVAMQALAIGSGVAVTAASAPGTISVGGAALGLGIAAATLIVLANPRAVRAIGRVARRETLRSLPVGTVVAAGLVTTVSWIAYGAAFWCLARGVLEEGTALSMATATGVFAAGYVVGLLALFAPGGVGVREAVFVALLTPSVGSGGAIVLSLASRILLTLAEAGAAGIGLLVGRDLLTAGRNGGSPTAGHD